MSRMAGQGVQSFGTSREVTRRPPPARPGPSKAAAAGYSSNERVLDMLLSFAHAAEGRQTVQAIAQAFGLSRSSTYRYLQILRARRLIVETETPGEYALGDALLSLYDPARRRPDVASLAGAVVDRLAAATREAVMLTRRQGDRVVVVLARESSQVIRISLDPARNLPMHVGSPAKVHLAHLPAAEVDRLLDAAAASGSAPAFDRARLERELADIRRRGWAESDGEIERGVGSVSVPVLDPDGRMIAGLTVAAPAFRLKRDDRKRIVALLLEATEAITGALGRRHEPPPAAGRGAR